MDQTITSQNYIKSPTCNDNGSTYAALVWKTIDHKVSLYIKGVSNYQVVSININASVTNIREVRFGRASEDLYIANDNGIHLYRHSDTSYTDVSSKTITYRLGISKD